MLAYQTAPRRRALAVVIVRDAAAAAARAKGGVVNLITDVIPGVLSVFTDEIGPVMLSAKFVDLEETYGAPSVSRMMASISALSVGYGGTMKPFGKEAEYPHAAYLEVSPDGAIPVSPIAGVEVIDVFYPDAPGERIVQKERASMWLWLLGATVMGVVTVSWIVEPRGKAARRR